MSKLWHHSFSLVRAQVRYDHILKHIQSSLDKDDDSVYHKISYIPGCSTEDSEGHQSIPLGPKEGLLQIHRSDCSRACESACREYKKQLLDDEDSGVEGVDRLDSRADYYYQAHHEQAETIDFILPRPLVYDSTINFVNEIEYDEKPRLINR